ncbi:MAG TPA: D-aminoacylase [Terriglobia bacterium]|nr:D-aminoacylase [Terriglobia bacterium]
MRVRPFLIVLLAALALPLLRGWTRAVPFASEFDLVIRQGRIIDGSGNPWYLADVGIRDGRIVAVGYFDVTGARRVIDAKGLVVAPGFIDVHTHVEGAVEKVPTADNFLFDGVTSIITGNCGGSRTEVSKWFGELRQNGISINLGTLIGHNGVRREVMGTEQRDPTSEEQAKMEALVERAMREGAVGFSTGLIYIPGTYSKTAEVIGLARVAAKHHGVYASHIRSEGEAVFEAIDEAIQIGREAGIPVEISHFKISNKRLWGRSARTIAQVEQARVEGLDVTVDQYPYSASSTNLGVLLPSWALAGGQEEVKKRLADVSSRKRIAAEMKQTIQRRNGRKRLDYAVVTRCTWDAAREGKSISQITREKGRKAKLEEEIQTVLEMIEQGGAGMLYHSMDEPDVERILRFPHSMVASDGGVSEFGVGVPHPRSYGTNARVLGRYVREKKVLRLEEAVRKMTSLPAQRFRLVDRGLVRPGMWADLVVFDEKTVTDTATFEKPHSFSAGFHSVLVNGQVVVEQDKHTGVRPGQILLGPGFSQQPGQARAGEREKGDSNTALKEVE